MRQALAFLAFVHAIAHLVGFAVSWRLLSAAELPYRTTILQGRIDVGDLGIRLYGLGWLGLATGFAVVAIGIGLRAAWWLPVGQALILLSVIFCVLGWPDTRVGVLANAMIFVMVLAVFRFGTGRMPVRNGPLEALWNARPVARTEVFRPERAPNVPTEVRRYREHVIAPGTRLASTVRLSMVGEIKLNGWHRFQAEQVISERAGFVWAASTSVYGLPVVGADRLLNGRGSMTWKMMGLLSVANADGSDITRSAAGRFQAELVSWLPAVLLDESVTWAVGESGRIIATREAFGERTAIELDVADDSRLRTVTFRRWGDPGGGAYRYEDFGVIVDEEREVGGYTIPVRIRAGWFFGTERFRSEGEFFRATVRDVVYE